jgi:branched-chain amino acid aminotransferase
MNRVDNFFLYGKGVFTTVAIRDRKPMLWEKHFTRLQRDMTVIGIDPAQISENELTERINAKLEASGIVDGRARITISDETTSPIWHREPEQCISIQVIVGSPREMTAKLQITRSPYPVNSSSPLAGVKSCNYLENLLAVDEAKKRGFDEAVRVNERAEVTSGCMSNLFWWKNSQLYTPSLKTGCLPGTTREYILENSDCREVEAGIDELDSAQAIFLTSAGIGIVEAAEFNLRKMKASNNPVRSLWPLQA